MSVIVARELSKGFSGPPRVEVLRRVGLEVHTGERIAIFGSSGAGKSTLMNLLGLLDSADDGTYEFCGNQTSSLSSRDRDRLRATQIGFVFQSSHVIGYRTVNQNLDLKLDILCTPAADRPGVIKAALGGVGLLHRQDTLGRVLSGGEKQRLAFARAVLGSPSLILADEPTGNLDDHNSGDILSRLTSEAERGAAVVVITHDARIGQWADRSYRLADGTLRDGR